MAIAETETPRGKVDRLAEELSFALANFWDGQFHAEVFPANKPYGGVKMVITDLGIPPQIELNNSIERTTESMGKAFPERDIRVYKTIDEAAGNATVIIMTQV
jgi:hypothetical protein